ncbi:hypothetical protein ABIA33_004043 [Streptacidiphilus sp. MAP12-16]|uniref:LamG-like jellyroll fold domain-containing protein n=1 Tax=Streptacidiphilus sp. MAP12-16 TaxID=3156300 RepID=UPI0035146586
MAARQDTRLKRRRLLMVGGAVIGVLAVGGAGAGVLMMNGHSSDQKAPVASPSHHPQPTGSSAPAPTQVPTAVSHTVGSIAPRQGSIPLGLGVDAKTGTVAGYAGQALKLPSGPNSFAMTSTPVVDTSKSFTVSVRVLGDSPSGNRAVVSQGAGSFYSFSIGRVLSGGGNHWVFKVQSPGGGSKSVLSKGAAALNQWTVLTGVYDVSSHQLRLYVNGAQQGILDVPGIQESTGGLQIGRVRSNSQWVDPWHGAVTDIQAWDVALSVSDIVRVTAGPTPAPGSPATAAWLTG